QYFRPFDVHEVFAHFHARFFTKLLRQVVGGRFSDQRFPATRGTVKEETFWRGVLKLFEKIDMQKWKLDRVLDCLKGRLLATNFFPRQLRNLIEIMLVRLCAREHFERHPV